MRLGDIEFSDSEIKTKLGANVNLKSAFYEACSKSIEIDCTKYKTQSDIQEVIDFINTTITDKSLDNKISIQTVDIQFIKDSFIYLNLSNDIQTEEIMGLFPNGTELDLYLEFENEEEAIVLHGKTDNSNINPSSYFMP